MSEIYMLGSVLVVAIFVYLVTALFYPERF